MKDKEEKRTFQYRANWYGEIIEGYTKTYSAYEAERNAIAQIAKKTNRTRFFVRNYLSSDNNKLEIVEIRKEKETDGKDKGR